MSNNDRWNAEHYRKHSATQFEGALAILNNCHFKGNEVVLDIGCGDGRVTAEIATHAPNGTVLGIDASADMIQACKQTFGQVKNLAFQCVSAEDFVTDNKFDLVVSFNAFHWIQDQEKVLKNIYQMLKPGGVFVLWTSGGNAVAIDEVFCREHWQKEFVSTEETWHGKNTQDYKNILLQCGFEDIKAETIQASRFFDNTEAFVNHCMAWVPYATGLSHDKALEFSSELADNVRSKMKIEDPQGRIEYVIPMALIWAQKSKK